MPRKGSNPNKAAVTRVTLMMFVWVAYLVFSLACISYSPSDPPSHTVVNFGPVSHHNWCGAFGAFMAYEAMTKVGPGIFVAIVLVGIALFQWTRGEEITQLPLRVIGGAMLVAIISTIFNLVSSNAD